MGFLFFFVFLLFFSLSDSLVVFALSLGFLFCFFLVGGAGFYGAFFSLDLLSWFLVLLSVLVLFLMVLGVGMVSFGGQEASPFFVFSLLSFFVFLAFSVSGYFSLFFFFECCVLPTFFVVLGWGFSEGRLQASLYFFLYTMVFSLPFLMFVFFYSTWFGSLVFLYSWIGPFFYFSLSWLPFVFFIFLVSLPVYFIHLWLPSAHVEAPLPGSMVLAAVLLSLGGYGVFRVVMSFYSLLSSFLFFLFSLGLVGSIYSSLSCFRQVDFSRMVAFMSVAHMGLILSGMLVSGFWGLFGGMVFMLAHGLVSSGLFCGVNVSYERVSTRSLFLVSGLLSSMPYLPLFLFLLAICNISFPPSMGFFSELFLLWGVLGFSFWGVIFTLGVVSLNCLCSLHLYTVLAHGADRTGVFGFSLTFRESILFFGHLFPLIVVFILF